MKIDYRELARRAVARARTEIESVDPDRLPYAALELRNAMEAITYSRAESYKDELPLDLYRVWQPRDVIKYLTEIDPQGAFATSSLAVGIEETPGEPAKVMRPLGTETALTMKDLKAHYDAFGSFLHIPTLDQMKKGHLPSKEKLKSRCERCADILDRVLLSPVWNINIGQFVRIKCHRCQIEFKWRYHDDPTEPMRARCIRCNAIHLLTREEGLLTITPDWEVIRCPSPNCEREIGIWRDEMQPGRWWKCDCGKNFGLVLRVGELKSEEICSP
jgi:hypothetical protein